MKPLTTRELTCLRWAAVGKTSWEVGMILGLTERTINFHIHNACTKLQVHGRQAAITVAIQAGLLPELTDLPLSAPPPIRQRTPSLATREMTPSVRLRSPQSAHAAAPKSRPEA